MTKWSGAITTTTIITTLQLMDSHKFYDVIVVDSLQVKVKKFYNQV